MWAQGHAIRLLEVIILPILLVREMKGLFECCFRGTFFIATSFGYVNSMTNKEIYFELSNILCKKGFYYYRQLT